MNGQLLLWLCTAAGAALFFGAGLVARRPRPVVTGGPSLNDDAERLRVQLAAVRAEHDRELAVARETARDIHAVQDRVERLRIDLMRAQKEAAELHQENERRASALYDARAELAQLRDELAALRAALRPSSRAPLTVRAAGHKAGDVLQALVDRVSGAANVRCAVVADDLGLVVASHGEMGDEVAAVGALFGRAGLQAQKVLPLRKVQRVTVEDDENVTLTLRPLQTDDTMEGDLALITLAVAQNERHKNEDPARSARPT